MRLERFTAAPDIVGSRIWLSWEYGFGSLETPGDAPDVLIRRKTRDFAFPPLVPGDPYLVYDSAAFPPAPVPGVLQVIDLPGEERIEDGMRVVTESISVARVTAGQPLEFQRHSRSVFYGSDGAPVRMRDCLLDAGGLKALEAYYYELDDGSAPGPEALPRYRGVAAPGGTYGINAQLYAMLPENLKTHDTRPLPPSANFPGIPETRPFGGQLRRFVDMFGMGVDSLRSSAEGLRNLRDPQAVQARFLPPLGDMIGWESSNIVTVPQQRNELQTATRLFDVVGTIPAMAALVTHQTGWRAQVAEFAQHVARSNLPARRNLFIRSEQGGAWRGAEDAASVFAFPPGVATGAGAFPAVLTSAAVEPFALRSGMELTLTVDEDVPARVRFGPDDFADLSAATAAEVAAVIAAAFDSIEAGVSGGAVVLRTVATGPEATLAVEVTETSLMALNDSPDGPVTGLADGAGRLRIVYEQRLDPTRDERSAFDPARDDLGGPLRRRDLPGELRPIDRSRRSILVKSWAYGAWRGDQPLPAWAGEAASPTAALLGDGRTAVAWIDGERSESARLRLALGADRAPRPASIVGRRAGPFLLAAGTQITFRGHFGTQVFTVQAGDYLNVAAATAAEVAAAITAQCAPLAANAAIGQAVRVSTDDAGDEAHLWIDLAASTAARALGFGERRLSGRGEWDSSIDWEGPLAGPMAWGPVADPALAVDPEGGARLFWAEHRSGLWRLRQAHWSERLTLVTATGASQQTAGGAWTTWRMADGLPSDDVRAVAADARGAMWFATAAGLAERRPDGTFTTFTTGDGLSSDDLRDLALLDDGSLWTATPAGISVRDPAGAISVIAAAPNGLADDDVVAVAADGLGNAWAATAAGVSRRGAGGRWRSWTSADGLPAGAARRIAAGPASQAALATAAGVAIFDGSRWQSFGTADGLPSADSRGVAWSPDGRLFAATAAGLAIWDGRRWQRRGVADGLPADDLRSVAALPDGRLALGTVSGIVVGMPFAPPGAWIDSTVGDGLAGPIVVGVHGGWSAAVTLASGGGGNREPRAIVDATDRTWLFWSRRSQIAATQRESWTLQLRRYDPANGAWSVQQAITAAPVGGAADREPAPEPDGAGFRLFFSSDRSGSKGLWTVAVDGAGVAAAPALLAAGAAENSRPAPVRAPGGGTWLIHRSDAPVALAQVAMVAEPGAALRPSERVPEARALALNAGARTPVMAHSARNLGRRRWGDYFAYTPEYPDLIDAEAPAGTHVYTRRTIGLYLRQSPIGAPITSEAVARLRQLVLRFLPVNLRVALIVAPDPNIEFVYTPGADIEEGWADDIPFVDALDGLSDAFAAAMPDVEVLIANELDSLSYEAANLATLRRRTWFPDLV
ncbi:MAG TPA: hypothetical protein VF759_10355 [Allosphingosinicella sp.]|jgi:hypothetical protein